MTIESKAEQLKALLITGSPASCENCATGDWLKSRFDTCDKYPNGIPYLAELKAISVYDEVRHLLPPTKCPHYVFKQ